MGLCFPMITLTILVASLPGTWPSASTNHQRLKVVSPSRRVWQPCRTVLTTGAARVRCKPHRGV